MKWLNQFLLHPDGPHGKAIKDPGAGLPNGVCSLTLDDVGQSKMLDIPPPKSAPDSRPLLVGPEVRTKIESIECEARSKGWPAELLWNAGFWDRPRGLAAVLEADDEIAEVTADAIKILKMRGELQTFRRQPA